jgi:hypothetical protein
VNVAHLKMKVSRLACKQDNIYFSESSYITRLAAQTGYRRGHLAVYSEQEPSRLIVCVFEF